MSSDELFDLCFMVACCGFWHCREGIPEDWSDYLEVREYAECLMRSVISGTFTVELLEAVLSYQPDNNYL